MKVEQIIERKGKGNGFKKAAARIGISGVVLAGGLGALGCAKEEITATPKPEIAATQSSTEKPLTEKDIQKIVAEAARRSAEEVVKRLPTSAPQPAAQPAEKPLTREDLQRITDEAAEKAVRRLPTQAPVSPNVQPVYPNPNVQAEVLYGDSFDVRLNGAANYEMIDTRTGQVLDYKRFMVQPISYQETGKGFERTLTYTLYPGQASVEEGVTVNGDLGPIVQIRRSSMPTGSQYPNYRGSTTGFPESFSPRILDGAVATLPTFGNAVAHAVNKANMLKVEKGINAIIRVR